MRRLFRCRSNFRGQTDARCKVLSFDAVNDQSAWQLAEGARKLFAVTPEGTAHLAEHHAEVAAMLARLDALAAMRQRTDAVPIRRAMHNLRSVLLSRLGEGLDKERMHEAVELIDEAARKIERL